MGTFTHAITLRSAAGDFTETLEALVDTGSTFLTVPRPVLERLGVKPLRVIRLQLANGQTEERAIGEIWTELGGIEHTALCVFGDPQRPPMIGAVTLQTFLFVVDTHGERLVPVEALWMYGI